MTLTGPLDHDVVPESPPAAVVWNAVVVNWRTPGDLSAFLGAWRQHAPASARLTIINNEPLAADVAAAHTHDDTDDIAVIETETNIGYARAVNYGVALGAAPFIAIFNADTRISAGLFDTLEGAFRAQSEWGVLGPKQVDDRNRITHAGIFGDNEKPFLRGWLEHDRGQYDDVRDDAVSVSGSAYFIRRSVWDELTACPMYRRAIDEPTGAFLPTQHYYEEMWASVHARSHGFRVTYFGAVTMAHRWHQASPHGGFADQLMATSREQYRAACDAHGLAHE